MEIVKVCGVEHRGERFMGVSFANKAILNAAIRKCRGCRWSQTRRCWLVPVSREHFDQLTNVFAGKAKLDSSGLKRYLSSLKKNPSGKTTESRDRIQTVTKNRPVEKECLRVPGDIHPVNAKALPRLREELKLKAYSHSTIKTYINEMTQLLKLLGPRPVDVLTEDDIRRYLLFCFEKLKLSEHTLHSRINALKFYFEKILNREKFFWTIPRPKKHIQLPKLLNEDELAGLFNALANRKHKAMLFTAYSAGLRVSEIVNLKLRDIDSERMQIFIERSKGKKDRYVNLSPLLLDILRSYVKHYVPRPKVFLFESEHTGGPYPTRTIQQIFSNAKTKAGIRKNVGIHSLRHSFATHLLDRGTDIRYIKEILGHFSIRTTERYLHVSKSQLVNIESPFDNLFRNRSIDWDDGNKKSEEP